MRNLFQFIIIILFANTSFEQQPCNDDDVMNTKGSWNFNFNALKEMIDK